MATMTEQDMRDSRYLSSSLSSLSHSRSTNSLIVRTYKEATQLYLTKRFREALDTLEPIISPRRSSVANGINGLANGSSTDGDGDDDLAPVAKSSRGTRTKVWVFYLSLLHKIIDLGAEEGKLQFGSSKWKELAIKAREGTVWDEVVRHGYKGNEDQVDPDVVVNLATLLLGHMHSQRLSQQRLEAYLASSGAPDDGNPPTGHDGTSTSLSTHSSNPKALQTRLKILELYALHVLPANEEWQYAQEFIEQCEALDDDRREAFLNALQQLVDEKEGKSQREQELKEQQEREMEQARREEEEARRAHEVQKEEERKRAEDAKQQQRANQQRADSMSAKTVNGPPTNGKSPLRPSSSAQTPSQNRRPGQRKAATPPTMLNRAATVLGNLQKMIMSAGQSMTGSSVALLRFLMFMLAFLLILARRDLRLKIRRGLESGWTKLQQTVGMGVKVSYV